MPLTQFNDPLVLSDGSLKVSGPFDSEGADLLGEVTIRFLLIQEPPSRGGGTPVIVDGVASWVDGNPDWTTTIPANRVPDGLRVSPFPGSPGKEGLLNAVGQAIVVRRVPSENVPVFDTITWCVTKELLNA